MSKLLQFPNEREIREAAALWIAQIDRGITPPEITRLHAWLNADPRHREVVLETADVWDRMDVLEEISELFPLEPTREPPSRPRGGLLAAVSAIAVSILGVAAWLGMHLLYRSVDSEYQTRLGEQRIIQLPDDSVVMLNTSTLLRVHYTDTARKIELLRGEAHFQVAHNRQRIFSVRVGSNEFRAVGTAFDVRVGPDKAANLTVTEGRVQVLVAAPAQAAAHNSSIGGPPATEIMVDAGKEVAVGAVIQTVRRLNPVQLDATLAWRRGMIVFDARPLEEAVGEVSRYSHARFRIDQDEIRRLPVSGYFKVGDIDALIAALQSNFNIQASRDGDTIVLRTLQTQAILPTNIRDP